MAECPMCGENIRVSSGRKAGDRLECPECGEALEVISLKPLELDYAVDDEDREDEWEEEEEND